MSRLQKLQGSCSKKQKTVNALIQKIMIRDIEALQENDPTIISDGSNNRFAKDEIKIVAAPDGTLEIRDDRGRAFLWVFEIQFEESIRTSDAFFIDKKLYKVETITESEVTETLISKGNEVINEFDNTISMLEADLASGRREHRYYDAHENVKCNSLREAWHAVWERMD